MATQAQKGQAFKALHEGEPFFMPNPWDAGSARVLEGLGFKALATTSSGFAFTLGRLDSKVTLDELADHVETLASSTNVPLSVDAENGFGDEPEAVAHMVRTIADAGAVGASVEDFDRVDTIYDFDHAVERVAAAVEAVRDLDFSFTLTARAENFVRDNFDLDDTIARLQAFERVGADVVYAPRLRTIEEMKAVCSAVSVPVNILIRPDLNVADIVSAGAQRISTGGNLTWVAIQAAVDVAKDIQEQGDLSGLTSNLPLDDWLN